MSDKRTLLLLAIASTVTLGACAGGASSGLRDSAASEILHEAWGQPTVQLNLGEVQFRRGDEYSGTFAPMTVYPMYQAAATMKLIRLEQERDLSASFTGWNDWFALTQAGVQRVATVTLLPGGEKVATVHPIKGSSRQFVTFVVGTYDIERVISIEPLEINGERYSQVIGTHILALEPEWRGVWAKSGNADYRERRFRALLKHDPIESKWRLQASDIGPRETDFPTAMVPRAIGGLRSNIAR